ncbi:hypothetical protein PsorP6_002723 [Peronosclerospora sorghi]|uniref:Uncharacterized protein n=1 Tax=Peronosclerospora sorghi TaxID=230839 RepID=A0ACC0WSD9_9STRA|nr:hypothetical protein PsorP6_002723 [Peronosclerospora sorghi]
MLIAWGETCSSNQVAGWSTTTTLQDTGTDRPDQRQTKVKDKFGTAVDGTIVLLEEVAQTNEMRLAVKGKPREGLDP